MCIYLLLLSYGHKTSYNTQVACYAQFTGDTPELHQGTYLSKAQVIYSFQLFALISISLLYRAVVLESDGGRIVGVSAVISVSIAVVVDIASISGRPRRDR